LARRPPSSCALAACSCGSAGRARPPITLGFFQTLQVGAGLTLRHFVYQDADGSRDAKDMAALLDLADKGKLRVEVGHRSDWSATDAVLAEMAASRLRGKAVLSVG
jgi:NADPH:quinone reductase-like Zn-dependent oxidoreductase